MGRTLFALALTAFVLTAVACTATSEDTGVPVTSTSATVETTRPTFDMTNFTIDQLTTGEPITWETTLTHKAADPLIMADLDGTLTLLAVSEAEDHIEVVGWKSSDGLAWDDLGPVLELDGEITSIDTVGDQIWLTVGTPEPQLWSSSDAVTWTSVTVVSDHDNPLRTFTPGAATGHEFISLIAGEPRIDAEAIVEPLVRRDWPGYESDRYGVEVRPSDPMIGIDILGPLGLVLIETTAEDLGLSPEDRTHLRQAEDHYETEVWVSSAGGEWASADIDGADTVNAIAPTSQGEFIAVGHTDLGVLALWRSFDGFFWEQLDYGLRPFDIDRWQDRLIGPSDSGAVDLLTSTDGVEWSPMGLGSLFPPSIQWFVSPYEADADGVTAAVHGFMSFRGFSPESEVALLERDGVEVTVEPFWDRLIVRGEDGSQDVWSASGSKDQGRMAFDPATESMTFQSEDGSPLVTLTFDEIDAMVTEYNNTFGLSLFHKAVAHRPADGPWTVWGIEHLEDRVVVDQVGHIGGNLVMVADARDGRGFRVWAAGLPGH